VEPEEQPPAPPPVVAVVVTHDAPGERLDAVLAALAAQDHPNLDVLLVATGEDDPTGRVRAVLPAAVVHRAGDVGFGAAANVVLDRVSGAEFYVFCHDDAAPDPGAVTALLDAAGRWGADVVGPKLVGWDDVHRLAQFGVTVDKVGVDVPYVERGELDQGQHDGLRDVFAVPGAFTLVRSARFAEVGGFDEAITFLGDDLSLAWRARLAGARVLVTSGARVRHAEAFADRPAAGERARLAARHRLRVVLTSYGRARLLAIVPQALALTLVEAIGALVTGRPGHARAALGAWPWNLRRLRSLLDARRAVAGFRRVPDRAVRRFQVPGLVGPRLRRLRVEGGGRVGPGRRATAGRRVAAVPVRGHMDVDPAAWSPAAVAVTVAMAAVVIFGSRHLLTRGVPLVGEMVPLGGGPGALVRQWAGGWRPAGLGSGAAPPLVVGAAGVVNGLVLGHGGLARMLMVMGLLPLGILGAHRLAAPLGSKRAQVAAAVAYAAVPLPYDALAAGRWSALAAYAAAPWMLGRLARASGRAPFGPDPESPEDLVADHGLVQHVVATGTVTALAGILVPQAPLLLLGMGAALVVGSVLALDARGVLPLAVASAGGAVVAALLHLPTTLDLLGSAAAREAWWGPVIGPEGLSALDVLGLRTGPTARGALAFALLAAAAVPLLVGRRWRFGWAVRAWTLAVAGGAVVWAREQGDLDLHTPRAGVVLAPAAAGLVLAVALGVAVVDLDVRGRSWRFGARRLVVAVGALALVASTASVVAGAVDGRWTAPRDDDAGLLGPVQDHVSAGGSRVLWVGDPGLVPGGDGWDLGGGLAFTAAPRAVPAVPDLWPATTGAGADRLRRALDAAVERRTTRLGRQLVPLGVEYVAVPRRLAPADPAALSHRPDALVGALAEQLDLQRLAVDPGLVLYRNAAFDPDRDGAVPTTGPGAGGHRVALAIQVGLWLVAGAVLLRMRFGAPGPPPEARHPRRAPAPRPVAAAADPPAPTAAPEPEPTPAPAGGTPAEADPVPVGAPE
jgi:GT2 family glycosyltransferase